MSGSNPQYKNNSKLPLMSHIDFKANKAAFAAAGLPGTEDPDLDIVLNPSVKASVYYNELGAKADLQPKLTFATPPELSVGEESSAQAVDLTASFYSKLGKGAYIDTTNAYETFRVD